MEPLKQLNLAMDYIETHLADDFDFQKVSQLAGCSEYYFRRIFSFLSGMTLNEYIRHRRLTQAAIELQQSTIKVIDLAVKYGYDSPAAFSTSLKTWQRISTHHIMCISVKIFNDTLCLPEQNPPTNTCSKPLSSTILYSNS